MRAVSRLFNTLLKRFTALWVYILDTPILYISLFSLLILLIIFNIYQSIPIYAKDLKTFLIFLLSILLIIITVSSIYIWKFSRTREGGTMRWGVAVQILFLSLLLGLRVTVILVTDYKTVKNLDSFTASFGSKSIQILDIDRSGGDIQEIIYKYEGVKGIGYVDWFEDLKIGDLCNTQMEIQLPENFSDFDYITYLKNRNIYFTSRSVEIDDCSYRFTIQKPADIFLWLKRNLRSLREELSTKVEANLPEPQASLLVGILFGSERAFSDQFEQQLRISGTTHIIAASGYNVTILILALNKTLKFIKKKYRLALSLIVIWMYCILSGLGASILRATVMGSITIVALLTGNVRNTHLLIPSGMFILLLLSPKILFDIGFQLSVLATLGLIYILPSIESFLEQLFAIKSVPQFLEENLLGTISCTLSTLPISISIFGKLSIVSIFANVLVLPLTESTMLYGTIALVTSFVYRELSTLLFSVSYIQLKIFEMIVEFFGNIGWGYIDISKGWIGWIIAILLFLFCIYFYPLDQENYYVKRLKDI